MVVKDVLLMFAKKISMSLQNLILEAWSNRDLLKEATYSDAVRAVIEDVDKGRLRVASPDGDKWVVN